MRILIVEDEKRLAGTLQDLLRRQGYTADVCYDGISGLDNARSDIYDLLVLDAMLPGMDGFALLRQLRGGGSRLPVLMLTARSELNDRVRGLDAGADYYLTKPFEPEELLACIRSLLRRGGEDAAADPEVTAFGDLTLHMGTFLLEDGVCSYSGLGDGYNTDDCYWEITKNGDYTHDGIRELHFDAICYIPDSSIPYFAEQYITNTDSELYDFYTGMWLTTATAYGNSQRGDNYYLHTVSWQGNSYLIEFAYSTNWQYNVGDWAQVLTKSYAVYLPEDYDGLVFAAEAQPDNYKDSAKRMQLDSISPEASLMDIDTVDPYRSLYFSLCY